MAARQFTVRPDEDGLRLDVLLTRRMAGLSRAGARDLLAGGAVRVNGRNRVKGSGIRKGDHVTVEHQPVPTRFVVVPDPDLPIRVRYHDRHLLIVDKPAGVPIHPLKPEECGTLANALVARFPETAEASDDPREGGLVHRLDTDTSGLVIAARSRRAFGALREALTSGRIEKRYRALCVGPVDAPQTVETYLVSDRKSRRVRVSETSGARTRPARTEILRSKQVASYSDVEIRVRSARRHQIRVHLAHLGRPLVGDTLYGGPLLPGLNRHLLHASSIRLRHPETGKAVRVSSPLPAEFRRVVETR